MGNPFIFRETVELLENNRIVAPPDVKERLATFVRHMDLAVKYKAGTGHSGNAQTPVLVYQGMHGAARLRELINRATTRAQILELINMVSQGDGSCGR
jgi:tRNA-dihydrouridine synthase